MKYRFISHCALPALLVLLLGSAACADASAADRKQPQSKTAAKKSATGKGSRKSKPRETSASVKRREQSVNREIQATQQKIDANESAVKENLSILTGLEHDIEVQNRKVAQLEAGGKQLEAGIAHCKTQLEEGEAELASLRTHYIAVMKKMRIARKKANPLAYIFASGSFYQAWRRMRYMRKFSDWRARRETEIKDKMEELERLGKQLKTSEGQLRANLDKQQQARKELAAKHAAQDATVKELRAQGDALRKHLAQKQAEANTLSARVVTLIAQEQEQARIAEQQRAEARARAEAQAKAKAEAERKAREEAERKAAEQAAAEKAAAEKAAREQALAENKAKPKAKPKAKGGNKKDKKKQEAEPQKQGKQSSGKDYAEARNRRPRRGSDSPKPAENAKPEAKPTPKAKPAEPVSSAASAFAASKGSLPRPATGSRFSIYSRFGRHALPDLPDVMYDNPGIDAVVDKGASARAVYAGTVTGVYVLPGFSTVVIVSHGDYYTVYGNIGTPSVSKGDKVKQEQALGKLVSDPDEGGRTTIHFEIYRNREKLNPESWIR